MSKIYGVTVGTPINPAHIEDKIKPVKTVNGKAPDENGNVEIEGGNGATGADGLTPYIKDGYWWIGEENTNVKAEGKDGKDGYTPIKGVDYFDGRDGAAGYTPVKGVDYFDGKDGYTPVKGIDYFDGKNGKDGATGAAGHTPVKGVDYFTASDKAAIVQDVLAALPYYDGSVTISGGVELISFTIAGLTYQAEAGMTWEQWCASEYNTGGYGVSNNWVCPNGSIYGGYVTYSNTRVTPTDTINGDGVYGIEAFSSGGA